MKTKLCGWPGCERLTNGGYYCEQHKALADARRVKPFQNAQRVANYRDPRWRKLSSELLREKGCCEKCGSSLHLSVHHVIPVRQCPERFLDRSNCVVLCASCHVIETNREINSRKREKNY